MCVALDLNAAVKSSQDNSETYVYRDDDKGTQV